MGNIWSSGPPARMTSRCALPARGVLTFEVTGYSKLCGLGFGKFISSAAFDVGGYRWCIQCYPDGDYLQSKPHVAVFLELLSEKAKARAFYEFRLVDQTTDLYDVISYSGKEPTLFSTREFGDPKKCFGTYNKFLEKTQLESSRYLKKDRFVVECHITVIKEPLVVKTSSATTASAPTAEPPSPNLSPDLSRLLETKAGADVTFKVKGQEFAAHTSVVAARSPFLKQLLSGEQAMAQVAQGHVTIAVQDMERAVFEALLQFVYTDSVAASMAGLDAHERNELCKRLLCAADRFDVKGLKFLCEKMLSEGLQADTVAGVLVLAGCHNCDALREACIEFIVSTDRLDDVVATDEYDQLKASSPCIFVDLFEKAAGLR